MSSIMHRADYQRVLIEEAKRLGVTIRLGCEVVSVESGSDSAVVQLANRETVNGDVIVGADGLHSIVRTAVLGYVKEPVESGDVAYRITIPRPLIQDDPDDFVRDIVSDHQERICEYNLADLTDDEFTHLLRKGGDQINTPFSTLFATTPWPILSFGMYWVLLVHRIKDADVLAAALTTCRPRCLANRVTWPKCTNCSRAGIHDSDIF